MTSFKTTQKPKFISHRSKLLVLIVQSILVISACSSIDCKRKDTIPPIPKKELLGDLKNHKKIDDDRVSETLEIFKYDGSLQCGMGTGVSVEVMADELKEIKIFSSRKISDGLMHIQVCSSPTGKINVFEIHRNDLKLAQARGFKVRN